MKSEKQMRTQKVDFFYQWIPLEYIQHLPTSCSLHLRLPSVFARPVVEPVTLRDQSVTFKIYDLRSYIAENVDATREKRAAPVLAHFGFPRTPMRGFAFHRHFYFRGKGAFDPLCWFVVVFFFCILFTCFEKCANWRCEHDWR